VAPWPPLRAKNDLDFFFFFFFSRGGQTTQWGVGGHPNGGQGGWLSHPLVFLFFIFLIYFLINF
jgi:hypothetical protein